LFHIEVSNFQLVKTMKDLRQWLQAIMALGLLVVLAGCGDTCEATNETHDCIQVAQPYDGPSLEK
jgi:hypothetical protein